MLNEEQLKDLVKDMDYYLDRAFDELYEVSSFFTMIYEYDDVTKDLERSLELLFDDIKFLKEQLGMEEDD